MAEAVGARQGARFLRSATLAIFTLAAGCSVVPKGPPRPVVTPPVIDTPDPVSPTLPTDVERNRVALLVPLTGPNAGVGTSISNAANMAVLDTGGAKIRVTMYDTGTGAAAAAQRALAEGNRLILELVPEMPKKGTVAALLWALDEMAKLGPIDEEFPDVDAGLRPLDDIDLGED